MLIISLEISMHPFSAYAHLSPERGSCHENVRSHPAPEHYITYEARSYFLDAVTLGAL